MSINLLNDRINVIISLASQFIVHNNECQNPAHINQPIYGIERKGIMFTFDLSCECYGYAEFGVTKPAWASHERHSISIIVAKQHNVFVNIGNINNLTYYKNTSNHNSCWKSDGFVLLHDFAYKMYNRVYANMPKEKRPNMINADFYIWDWLRTFMQPVSINCKSINCKSIEDNYYEQITDLKKIHITDLFKK